MTILYSLWDDDLGALSGRTFAEFFAGIGLVRLALERAGWKAVFANDIDPKKFEMYRRNFKAQGEVFLLGDIHKVEAAEVPTVDLATASFPCTDLSVAGGRRGLGGSQSSAFWGFHRLLEEMGGRRPRLVLIENVMGFVTSHGGQDFAGALAALNRLGYAVDAFVLDAVHFVPQSRPRVFVVGVLDAPRTRDVTGALAARDVRLRWRRLTDFIIHRSDIAWTILNIPAPPARAVTLEQIIEEIPSDSSRWWSDERVVYLLGQTSPRHRRLVDSLMQRVPRCYLTVYRRVRRTGSMAEVRGDGIAGCLRTPRGGSSRQILLVVGGGEIKARFMTPREYARLMGVPDDYTIDVPDNQAYFGFGDAVCVPAVEWVAEVVLNPLVEAMTVPSPSEEGVLV